MLSGASGLRSQVSRWLGPPQSSTKMHDFSAAPARGERSASNRPATRPGTPSDRAPMPPAWRKRRRDIGLDDGEAEGWDEFMSFSLIRLSMAAWRHSEYRAWPLIR